MSTEQQRYIRKSKPDVTGAVLVHYYPTQIGLPYLVVKADGTGIMYNTIDELGEAKLTTLQRDKLIYWMEKHHGILDLEEIKL